MALSTIFKRLFGGPPPQVTVANAVDRKPGKTIVILIDGTLSSRRIGWQTNVGLTADLLRQVKHQNLRVHYQPGVQWSGWWSGFDIVTGRGINHRIRRAYGALASWYEPGDQIILIGYSRGAYAVRSLAGVIDRVGLLRRDFAASRHLRTAYRHYVRDPDSPVAQEFSRRYCHNLVPVAAIGVWDTVKALGIRLPVLWRFADRKHAFHNHSLGPNVGAGFHALALNERRRAFAPILWHCQPDFKGQVSQVWFRGTHGDIGGQILSREKSRPLSNIPLVWLLEQLSGQGLPLPDGWQKDFPQDATAPSIGSWTGTQKFFLWRKDRKPLHDRSEAIHPTARDAT